MNPLQRGYTLIETLISLSIFSLLLTLPILFLHDFRKPYEVDYLAHQFKEDILLAQHIAMTHGRTTYIKVDLLSNDYVIRFSANDEYFKRPIINKIMQFSAVSMGVNDISFNPNGNPRKSGTIQVKIHDRVFHYTIYLGRGRVYYREV
ncbi:competence type IV pilus minor pilin ComGD [Bacillus solitudinis]|uniref:competence type IV pilus minor pilin ComGD n=1 Tax=Bacillus solitudinis TaxID=2014074 RepID=UPI000C242D88|nr:competence type IV pilus minor pilin ComGD [Bacillus solitudinis]